VVQVVNTATACRGARRTPISTVPMTSKESSAAARVLSAPTSLQVHPAVDRVRSATEPTSAAQCRQWTATTTPTCAVPRAQLTTPALKVG